MSTNRRVAVDTKLFYYDVVTYRLGLLLPKFHYEVQYRCPSTSGRQLTFFEVHCASSYSKFEKESKFLKYIRYRNSICFALEQSFMDKYGKGSL